jgi:Lon protease-like protein
MRNLASIMDGSLPEEIGVIVLPGAVLFPHTLLPLFIFEPRYRSMLERALETDRIFAVGTQRDASADEPFPVGGAGIIRACVRNPDGTSHLMLEGIQRVRFLEWTQREPYRIARVEPLVSRNGGGTRAGELATLIKEICRTLSSGDTTTMTTFEQKFLGADDAETLSDTLSSALVEDPDLRRRLLAELDVPTRLNHLIACLRERFDRRDETDIS